jgi:glycosyltransferase involved in cell wall biosynthesis
MRSYLRHAGFTNVSILGRGIDSQLFSPIRRRAKLRSQWGIADDDVAVLYVGRLAPEKNLPLAVEAYRAMQQVGKTLKFVIVGDGPLRVSLQQKHAEFIFCGILSGEQLAEHYASADVFLFPSETETFGNVTLEAMASGLAVVAYDYAAANMYVRHGHNGLLAPSGHAQAFIEAAVRLVHEPQTRNTIRWEAHQSIVNFDWRQVVKHFELLLANAGSPVVRPNFTTTPTSERSAMEGRI